VRIRINGGKSAAEHDMLLPHLFAGATDSTPPRSGRVARRPISHDESEHQQIHAALLRGEPIALIWSRRDSD
jgi:hypothetical protein